MNAVPASPKDTEELEVYRNDLRVGLLSRTRAGARFVYDRACVDQHLGDAGKAVAFTLPIRKEPFDVAGVNLHPFFAGLLPEGLRLTALTRALKTSGDDLFSLLVAAGPHTIGDVWVKAPGVGSMGEALVADPARLSESGFMELFEESLLRCAHASTATVAGVQPKLSAGMISFPLKARTQRRDYILKLSPPGLPNLVENEAFFMGVARGLRLSTATVKVVHDREGHAGLLVERFDRVQRGDDKRAPLLKLHQEDACQLLGRYPADKYRLGLREVAEALEVCSAPLVERLRLMQLQALSYLIVNGDLHGKNISVQTVGGQTRLTPIYDLLCTLPYDDDKLAIKIEGRDKKVTRKDFIVFGERMSVRRAATERMLDTLVKGIGLHLTRLNEIGLDKKQTRHMELVISERLGQLMA